MKPRIAIYQPSIIWGGRFRVVLDIIRALNHYGIVPDVLTAQCAFSFDELSVNYGYAIDANLRMIRMPRLPKFTADSKIAAFNARINQVSSAYDILINTSNSLLFLPKGKQVINYVFFPRKGRLSSPWVDIHQPDLPFAKWSIAGIQKLLLRRLYCSVSLCPEHHIIAMTEFTKEALRSEYPFLSDTLPVIYPPVDIDKFQAVVSKETRTIVSLGRFSPDKRQIEQIALAKQLPDYAFHIAGFTGNGRYFAECQEYVRTHQMENVYLHPNLPFDEMVLLLQRNEFFLHTLINEPFGITAVQAIAAGCVPFVHDSGGQRETVPVESLRYQQLSEVPAQIGNHQNSPDRSALIQQLQEHILLFDQDLFYAKILDYLANFVSVSR